MGLRGTKGWLTSQISSEKAAKRPLDSCEQLVPQLAEQDAMHLCLASLGLVDVVGMFLPCLVIHAVSRPGQPWQDDRRKQQ